MGKGKPVEILRENLREHPAVLAWRELKPERAVPETITVIKGWSQRKSGVYKLPGVGPGGSAVIAKRCPIHTGAVEQSIYEEFLPHLPLPTLGYYGSVEDPDRQSRWLFLEEACGDQYSPQNNPHRALAARWLAALHILGQGLGSKLRLPDRSPIRYLRLLQSVRSKVREQITNPGLPPDGAAVLETVDEQCEVVESHWSQLEGNCNEMPQTLVHGDFVVKNMRVRHSAANGPELLVFDWEYAGRGAPSADLAQSPGGVASPDLAVYRSCLQNGSMMLDDMQVQWLAQCGRLFRVVETMYWATLDIAPEPALCLLKPISELRIYSQRMAQALSEAGWRTAN